MKKLIEKNDFGTIVCDNPNCDYEYKLSDKNEDDLINFVGKKCPKCGNVLLTEKDYNTSITIMKVVNFINKYFSWITLFLNCKKTEKYSVHINDGINLKKKDDNQLY